MNTLAGKFVEQLPLELLTVKIAAIDVVLVAHEYLAHASAQVAHFAAATLLVGVDAAVCYGKQLLARKDSTKRLA